MHNSGDHRGNRIEIGVGGDSGEGRKDESMKIEPMGIFS